MGTQPVNIWESEQLLVSNVSPSPQANVVYTLGTTPVQGNALQSSTSLNLIVEYEDISPDILGGGPPFRIGAVVESINEVGKWFPIAYQFATIRNSENPSKRILRMQPDISDFNAGVDDVVFPVTRSVARISRQQGILPEANWRVSILVSDSDPNGQNGLVSVTVSISGERYGDHGGLI